MARRTRPFGWCSPSRGTWPSLPPTLCQRRTEHPIELHEAKILIVDDEPILREIFARWFQLAGCGNIRTAQDGEAALETIRLAPIDLLITDVRMPVMDGITLVRRLVEAGIQVPSIIFVSGFGDIDHKEMYALGVEAFLAKPLRREDLLTAIVNAIASRSTLWRKPMEPAPKHTLVLEIPGKAGTDEGIRFGRGGFCIRHPSPLSLGKIAFDCHLLDRSLELSGQGFVRWYSRADFAVGIEIAYLDPPCRPWLLEEIDTIRPWGFIPTF